jgi:ABC-type multidrug transport system fused ATPase/permease subunit
VGDVLSRFGSTEPIRNLPAEGLIAAAIDGAMVLATMAMILAYSLMLAAVVFAAVVLHAALRPATYRAVRRRTEAAIDAKAEENSAIIETVHAMQGVKLFSREAERKGVWLNRYALTAKVNTRVGRFRSGFKTMDDAIFALENILTVYLATRLVLDGAFSLGMVFAFMGYKRGTLPTMLWPWLRTVSTCARSTCTWSARRTSRSRRRSPGTIGRSPVRSPPKGASGSATSPSATPGPSPSSSRGWTWPWFPGST